MPKGRDPYPVNGFPAQISAAHRIAGDDVTEEELMQAAWAAWKDGKDIRVTLEEVAGDGE